GCRDRDHLGAASAKPRSLVIDKKEGVILFDRSAEGPSELVLTERRLTPSGIEVVVGVQLVIAQEFENIAVVLVRAGFDRYIDSSSGAPSEFCGHGIGLHLEFGDRVRRRDNGRVRVIRGVV